MLTHEQYGDIKSFISNEEIIVRRADKGSTFIIMDRSDYLAKLESLFLDSSKFTKLNKDTSQAIKTQINKDIELISEKNNLSIKKIAGHHEPDYIFVNPKIHKSLENPPLRPIVSQNRTVTYNNAKRLNSIIIKYLNQNYLPYFSQFYVFIIFS